MVSGLKESRSLICCHKDDASFFGILGPILFKEGLYIGICFFSKKTEGTENRASGSNLTSIQPGYWTGSILGAAAFFPHPAAKRARVQTRKRKGRSNFLIEIHPFHASLYHVFQNKAQKTGPPQETGCGSKVIQQGKAAHFPSQVHPVHPPK